MTVGENPNEEYLGERLDVSGSHLFVENMPAQFSDKTVMEKST